MTNTNEKIALSVVKGHPQSKYASLLNYDGNNIDAKNLDSLNNGLVFASHRFKNNPLCAQITFDSEQCVRSELAKSAIDVLKL